MEGRKAIVGAHLRVRPLVGGHIGRYKGRKHITCMSATWYHANDHFLTDITKDEKWLVLVGRPSLAASRWRARRPTPLSYFHINLQTNDNFIVGADPCVRPELRAHTRVRPYSSAFFDCDSVSRHTTAYTKLRSEK